MPATLPPPSAPVETKRITGFTDMPPASDPLKPAPANAPVNPDLALDDGDSMEATLEKFRKAEQSAQKPKPVEKKPEEKPLETTIKPEAEKPDKPKSASPVTAEMTDAELEKHIGEHVRGLDSRQAKAFKTLTYETREQKRDLKKMPELLAEIETLKNRAPQPDTAQLAILQKKLDDAQKRMDDQETELAGSRVEATTLYRSEVGAPMAQLEAAFKQVAEDYELAPESILEAAALKGKARGAKLAELALDMTEYDKTKFFSLVDQWSVLQDKRAAMMANAKQTYAQMQAGEREQAESARTKADSERKEAVPKVWESSILKFAPFLKEIEGNAEWNTALAQSRDYANTADFHQSPVAEQVEILHRAATFPLALRVVNELQAVVAKQHARISELTAAKPGIGGASPNGASVTQDPDKEMTFEEAFARGLPNVR